MKNYLTRLPIILLFFLMLCFPKETFDGACSGLLLWFHTVLPTLLPFVIVSNLLIHTHAVDLIVHLTGPLLSKLLHVSDHGSFAVLAGFLCGYPMGSKITADLLKRGQILPEEASYLLSFCNNTSPAFIISYVVLRCMNQHSLIVPALLILTAAPILASFLFRRKWFSDAPGGRMPAGKRWGEKIPGGFPSGDAASENSLADLCIMNGFETITKVGGYIMLFSIFLALAARLPVENGWFHYVLLPSLEVTNGISLLAAAPIPDDLRFLLAMMLTSFGGWCAVAQTKCMIAGTGLSIRAYIIEKLVTTGITSLLTFAYLIILHQA